jgi:hypothetical protein
MGKNQFNVGRYGIVGIAGKAISEVAASNAPSIADTKAFHDDSIAYRIYAGILVIISYMSLRIPTT